VEDDRGGVTVVAERIENLNWPAASSAG